MADAADFTQELLLGEAGDDGWLSRSPGLVEIGHLDLVLYDTMGHRSARGGCFLSRIACSELQTMPRSWYCITWDLAQRYGSSPAANHSQALAGCYQTRLWDMCLVSFYVLRLLTRFRRL